MKVLITGSQGMLGQALVTESKKRNHETLGIDLNSKKKCVDITKEGEIKEIFNIFCPEIVINTVAIIDLNYCEKHPDRAYLVNTKPVSSLINECRKRNAKFVQISTDQYYQRDKRKKHKEIDKVKLLNEYARTKYLAEKLAELYENTLVIRTNIVGFRNIKEQPTFVEWFINKLEQGTKITLYDDYYTSSIDVMNFSKILLDLINKGTTGILNLASRTVSSKKEFIEKLAGKLDLSLENAIIGSVFNLSNVRKAESLGLDTEKIENVLGMKMPNLEQVTESLLEEYKRIKTKRGIN